MSGLAGSCTDGSAAVASNLIPRYSRQMVVPTVGIEGQVALSESSVLVVGAGGIGSTVLLYLAGAGVGHIGVLDFDTVEISNLHRQIIHKSSSEGLKKCDSATAQMRALNDKIKYTTLDRKLTTDSAMESFKDFDLIVDATDNFEARYIINDACVLLGKPLVSGSSVGMEGQVTVFAPRIGPCYRCLYPSPSLLEGCRSCANAGVLGPIPGLIGCLQAVEVIKVLLSGSIIRDITDEFNQHIEQSQEIQDSTNSTDSVKVDDEHVNKKVKSDELITKNKNISPLIGRQMFYDGAAGEFHNFILPPRNPSCAVCGVGPSIRSMEDTRGSLSASAQRMKEASPDLSLPVGAHISIEEYSKLCLEGRKHVMLDVRSDVQYNMVSFNWYSQSGGSHSDKSHNFEKNEDNVCIERNDRKEKEKKEAKDEEEHDNKTDPTEIRSKASSKYSKAICGAVVVIHIPLAQLENALDDPLKMKELRLRLESIITLNLTSERMNDTEDRNENNKTNVFNNEKTKKCEVSEGNEDNEVIEEYKSKVSIYCMCRRGHDSILATQIMLRRGFNTFNVTGGLSAWSKNADKSFPTY